MTCLSYERTDLSCRVHPNEIFALYPREIRQIRAESSDYLHHLPGLTIYMPGTKIADFVNSVHPDEAANNGPTLFACSLRILIMI